MTKPFNISQNEATAKMYLDLAMAKCDAAMRRDRFEAAVASNRRTLKGDHDAYCNQMPRARGFRT